MTQATDNWRTTIFTLLAHPSQPRMLLQAGPQGWSLPGVELEGQLWASQVDAVLPALRDQLGLDTLVLRAMPLPQNEQGQRLYGIYVLEQQGSTGSQLPGGRWVDRQELRELALALPEQRPALERYLDELEGTPPSELRPAWAYPGWYERASAWIHQQLVRLGYQPHGPVEQIKTWGVSCILRVQTSAGKLYFKVASTRSLFTSEPLLLQGLATLCPGSTPVPVAVEPEQGWMLLPEFGKQFGGQKDMLGWAQALQTLGRLQLALAGRVEELLAIGCLDRRQQQLEAHIDTLLADDEALAGLTPDEVAQLRAIGPQLKAMGRQLLDYRVPPSLVHGDFHGGNVAVQDDGYLIFDWTDACVAHPFLDLATALPHKDLDAREQLLASYLELWHDYEPPQRLREAWALAAPLAELHQAISYQHIVAALEPDSRHELDWGVPFFVRRALAVMPDQPQATG